MFKKFLFITLFSFFGFAYSTSIVAKHIDLADKLRVRTQKFSKEVFLIQLNINKEQNLKNLKITATNFTKTLNELEGKGNLKAIKTEAIEKELQIIKQLWQQFDSKIQNILNNKATDKDYEFIKNNNFKFLKTIMRLVNLYTKFANEHYKFKYANNINYAGKNRTRCEKIVKDILAYKINKDKKNLQELQKTINLFEKTLNGLIDGSKEFKLNKTTLPTIRKQLLDAKNFWQQTKPLIFQSVKNSVMLSLF